MRQAAVGLPQEEQPPGEASRRPQSFGAIFYSMSVDVQVGQML
jgi:hypothetical protein